MSDPILTEKTNAFFSSLKKFTSGFDLFIEIKVRSCESYRYASILIKSTLIVKMVNNKELQNSFHVMLVSKKFLLLEKQPAQDN